MMITATLKHISNDVDDGDCYDNNQENNNDGDENY